MSQVRWDPFGDVSIFRQQVNRMFEHSLARSEREPVQAHTWTPTVDIYETEREIVLAVEVPGVKPEEIDIQITGDTLTIRGERKLAREDNGRQYMRIERSYGPFQRSFTLGVPINQQQVKAAYRDGLLEITLPKAEEVKPKQVKVEILPADVRQDEVQ